MPLRQSFRPAADEMTDEAVYRDRRRVLTVLRQEVLGQGEGASKDCLEQNRKGREVRVDLRKREIVDLLVGGSSGYEELEQIEVVDVVRMLAIGGVEQRRRCQS